MTNSSNFLDLNSEPLGRIDTMQRARQLALGLQGALGRATPSRERSTLTSLVESVLTVCDAAEREASSPFAEEIFEVVELLSGFLARSILQNYGVAPDPFPKRLLESASELAGRAEAATNDRRGRPAEVEAAAKTDVRPGLGGFQKKSVPLPVDAKHGCADSDGRDGLAPGATDSSTRGAISSHAVPSIKDGELIAMLDAYAKDGTRGYQFHFERIKSRINRIALESWLQGIQGGRPLGPNFPPAEKAPELVSYCAEPTPEGVRMLPDVSGPFCGRLAAEEAIEMLMARVACAEAERDCYLVQLSVLSS